MSTATTERPARPVLTLSRRNPAIAWGGAPNSIAREFQFADGDRPICIDRRAVAFACPLKTDPENLTLVGFRSNAGPVPIRVAYADFCRWWSANE